MSRIVLISLACLGACAAIPEVGDSCGPDRPVIDHLWLEDCGSYTFANEETWPSVFLLAEVWDADGDLTSHGMRVYWDEALDGRVSPDGAYMEMVGGFEADACSADAATLGIRFALTGGDDSLPYDADLELGVAIIDAALHRSDPLALQMVTPAEDGTCAGFVRSDS